MLLASHYESLLKQYIYTREDEEDRIEKIMYVYRTFASERWYIGEVIDEVVRGKCSDIRARSRLENNVIRNFEIWRKKEKKILEQNNFGEIMK